MALSKNKRILLVSSALSVMLWIILLLLKSHMNVVTATGTLGKHSQSVCSVGVTRSTATNFTRLRKIVEKFVPMEFNKEYKDFCWNSQLELSHLPSVHQLVKSLAHYELTVSDVVRRIAEISNPKNPLTITCLPSVFMAGFPKSGSTYVYDLLTRHPDLISGREKEPHFWNRFHFGNQEYDTYAFLTYLANFIEADKPIPPGRRKVMRVIDASQSTLWDTHRCNDLCAIPSFLKDLIPEAKFIMLMRDPVDQLYSDYWDFMLNCNDVVKGKNKKLALRKAFLPHVTEESSYLVDCVKKRQIDECIHNTLQTVNPSITSCGKVRLGISIYVVHIKRWLKYFKKEQFLFLRLEDVASNPYNVFTRVWKFLDVKKLSEEEFFHITSTTPRTASSYPQMDDYVRSKLNHFYAPFNVELADLLNNTDFLWKYS